MNRNEERRDLSKKILVAMLSYDDGNVVQSLPTFQKNLAKVTVDYADALLDELDKRESATTEEKPVSSGWYISYRVATEEMQVGDLVMYQPFGTCAWYGPSPLKTGHECDKNCGAVKGAGLVRVRHLTDEERAQIKRI